MTSLPRRPVSRPVPGVLRKASTAAVFANACWSLTPAYTRRTSPKARLAALVEASGTPGTGCTSATAERVQRTPSAVTAQDPGQAQDRQRREHQNRDGRKRGCGRGDDRVGPADRVAEEAYRRADVGPVYLGVERSVEGHQESHVEDLQDGHHAENPTEGHRRDPSRPSWQQENRADEHQCLDRDAHERTWLERTEPVRTDEGDPHEKEGQDSGHPGGSGAE